jgi:hypothetical protein
LTTLPPSDSAGENPPSRRFSPRWFWDHADRILLGKIKIPGWLGILFTIFWGVPNWNSRIQFWTEVARATSPRLAPFADVLAWTYFPGVMAIVSLVYLAVVSRSESSASNTALAAVAWLSLGLVGTAAIAVTGFGAIEVYIQTEIAKGKAGLPREDNPADSAKNGTDRPLYARPRDVTQNQRRLATEIPEGIASRLPKPVVISYLKTDMEAFAYASQLRQTFERAAISTEGPFEQALARPGLSGIYIEADDIKSPAGIALQQALVILGIHAELAGDHPRYGNSPVVLFVGPRPIQP